MLIEYDLVAPNYDTANDYGTCILDKEENVANPFRHQGRYWILKPTPERPEKSGFMLAGVQLSFVGYQLFHIVEQIPVQQHTQELKEFLKTEQLEMVEVSIQKKGENTGWRII